LNSKHNIWFTITFQLNFPNPKDKALSEPWSKMNIDFNTPEDELWEEFNDPSTTPARRVEILYSFGYRESWKLTFKEPMKYWMPALEMARENQLVREWVEVTEVITREYITTLHEYELAIEMANEGLGLIPELAFDQEDRNSQAHLTWGKAVAYDNLEKYPEALVLFNLGSKMYANVGNDILSNILASASAFIHTQLDEHDEAARILPDIREFFIQKEDLARVAYCDLISAIVMMHKGQYQEALELALEVKSVEKQVNKLDSGTMRWVAKAYYYTQDYEEAVAHYRQAIKMASKKPERDYKDVVKANLGLAEVFEAQGKTREAAAARFDAKVMDKRLKKPRLTNSANALKEVAHLRSKGEYDLANQRIAELVQESSEAGDISLRLRAECEYIITNFFKEDYEGVANTWEAMPRATLELHDELVIKIKNMVCHSLAKLGRVQEAADLNNQVLSDFRVAQNKQEQAYAFENRVEIESDPNEKKKHISYAIETNLEAQNPDRALKITRKFRDQY
jgi:tetratricopeptide (TPR) repeat protein